MYKIKLSHLACIVCFAAATVACKDDDNGLPADTTAPTISNIEVDDAYLLANETATITVQAQDETNGSGIARVEFYNGSTKIGEDTSSPYTYTWTAGAAYTNATITAMAIDNSGNTSQASDAVTIRVGERIEAESGELVLAEGSEAYWQTRDDGNQHYEFVNEQETGADIPVTVPEAGNYIIALVAATGWTENPVTARVSANGGEFQAVSIPVTGWVDFRVYPAATPVALTAGENMISVRQGDWFHHLDAIEVYKE
jgi:hypothetical protein